MRMLTASGSRAGAHSFLHGFQAYGSVSHFGSIHFVFISVHRELTAIHQQCAAAVAGPR